MHIQNQENKLKSNSFVNYQSPNKYSTNVCEYQQYEVIITNIESNFDGQYIINYTQSRLKAQQLMREIQQVKAKIKQAQRSVEKLKYQYGSYEQQIYQFNLQMNHLKTHRISLRQNQIRQLKRIANANYFENVLAQYQEQLQQNQKNANINLLNFLRNYKSKGIVKKVEQLIYQQQNRNRQFEAPIRVQINQLQKKTIETRKHLKLVQSKLQHQQNALREYRIRQQTIFKEYNQILNKKQRTLSQAYQFVKHKAFEAYKQYTQRQQSLTNRCQQSLNEQFIQSMVANFEENLEAYYRTYVKMQQITRQIVTIKHQSLVKKNFKFEQENQINLFNMTSLLPKWQINSKQTI